MRFYLEREDAHFNLVADYGPWPWPHDGGESNEIGWAIVAENGVVVAEIGWAIVGPLCSES